ncbi:17-beta-hydroxysteroid dehydrogenase type 6 [Halotydeus destructor]|nr:17-beta-hydroxysteroid dehydrogenase type 6 [Halotydeus destructor]
MGAYNSSKAAVRIMTDCFRAELSIFGIKVILVEPAVFKTGITNYGTMVSMMNGSWDRSEQHVKDSYGKPLIDFVSLLLNQCDFFADYIDLGRSGSCNKVIDCIEEGIMSYEPQSLYSPAPFFAKIASKTIFVLPHEFLDAIGYFYASYALYGGLVYDKLLRATNIKS